MRLFKRLPPIHDILDGILAVGDLMTVFTQTVIVGFMPMIMLGVLLIVEHIAVSEGIRLFDVNETSVFLAAFGIVILNFCIEFWSVYVDTREQDRRKKYHSQKRKKASLRISLRGALYWLGIGKRWKEQDQPASGDFRSLQRVVTAVMLALALAGRMHVAIEKVSGVDWQTGLQRLVSESSLLDIAAWVGGILLTYATIKGAQRLTYYNAVRVVDIRQWLKDRSKSRKVATTRAIVQDAYEVEKVRDNRLAPIRIADKYQCPECGKVMSKQGWSKHPCRFDPVYVSVDHNRRLVDGVDGQLSQPEVNEQATTATASQFSSNGHGQRGQ
jgi:hypothetical protein